jgi:hypothetical protein
MSAPHGLLGISLNIYISKRGFMYVIKTFQHTSVFLHVFKFNTSCAIDYRLFMPAESMQ